MLTIEQELECSVASYELRNLETTSFEDRPAIVAEVYRRGCYETTWTFDAKTGVLIGAESQDEPLRIRPKSQTRAINHFYIHAGMRDWEKDSWIKLAQEHFSEGGAASERSKQHNALASTALSPFRFMVKKEVELSPVRDYPAWAEYRFASGDWEQVPWANESWAQTEATKHHFTHISKSDDSKVAFWETEEHACLDSPLTLSPGRYLQRFFGEVLSQTEIRDWAVKVDAEAVLKFAYTPDEIHAVYAAEGGPSSCMRYPDHTTCHDGVEWRSGINPVRAYGAGDLAIAYIERKGKIAGRALVWPDKKLAGRRYGDIERLNAALEAEGYKFDSSGNDAYAHGNGGFDGARLLKIVPEDHEDNLVMPYLDLHYRFNIGEEFLTLSKTGAHFGNRTDGLAYEPSEDEDEATFCCDRCGDDYAEDDYFLVPGREDWYCQSCYNALTINCERCSCTVARDSSSTIDGAIWCDPCAEEHSTTCDYCNESFDRDDLVPIYDARYEGDPADADVHADACVDCRDSDAENIQQDVNGVWIDTDTATHCDACHNYFSGNLDEEECPNTTCVERRAEEAAAEATETENA